MFDQTCLMLPEAEPELKPSDLIPESLSLLFALYLWDYL